jgi:N-acetylmuramoyl-L-alanine amidase
MLPLRRQPTVVIDPGHDGIDRGAISPNGVYEKDFVLPIPWDFCPPAGGHSPPSRPSVLQCRRIHTRPGRSRPVAWHADLFLSIHADAAARRGNARLIRVCHVGAG